MGILKDCRQAAYIPQGGSHSVSRRRVEYTKVLKVLHASEGTVNFTLDLSLHDEESARWESSWWKDILALVAKQNTGFTTIRALTCSSLKHRDTSSILWLAANEGPLLLSRNSSLYHAGVFNRCRRCVVFTEVETKVKRTWWRMLSEVDIVCLISFLTILNQEFPSIWNETSKRSPGPWCDESTRWSLPSEESCICNHSPTWEPLKKGTLDCFTLSLQRKHMPAQKA